MTRKYVDVLCSHEGCGNPAKAKFMCWKHYTQSRLEIMQKRNTLARGTCKIVGCNNIEKNNYLCEEHLDVLRH